MHSGIYLLLRSGYFPFAVIVYQFRYFLKLDNIEKKIIVSYLYTNYSIVNNYFFTRIKNLYLHLNLEFDRYSEHLQHNLLTDAVSSIDYSRHIPVDVS